MLFRSFLDMLVMFLQACHHPPGGHVHRQRHRRGALTPLDCAPRTNHDAPRVTNRKETLMGGTANMIGLGLAAIGPAIGVGLIFAAYVSGVARQPEAQGRLQSIAIFGFVLAEQFFIISLALAFVLKP